MGKDLKLGNSLCLSSCGSMWGMSSAASQRRGKGDSPAHVCMMILCPPLPGMVNAIACLSGKKFVVHAACGMEPWYTPLTWMWIVLSVMARTAGLSTPAAALPR